MALQVFPQTLATTLNSSPSQALSLRKRPKRSNIDVVQVLDIAESGVKTVPLLGNTLEGSIATARKTWMIAQTVKSLKEECLDLAEQAALITASICKEVVRSHSAQNQPGVMDERVTDLISMLKNLETYMTDLSQYSLAPNPRSRSKPSHQIDKLSTITEEEWELEELQQEEDVSELKEETDETRTEIEMYEKTRRRKSRFRFLFPLRALWQLRSAII